MLLKLAVFIAATVTFGSLSRRSLCDWRRHGFFRLFAFEFLLALILLNADVWFYLPAFWNQLVSWPLLAGSGHREERRNQAEPFLLYVIARSGATSGSEVT